MRLISVGLIVGSLAGATIFSGCASSDCKDDVCMAAPAPKVEFVKLSTDEMAKIVEEKKVLIFDARSGKYDDGRRIPGAKSLNDQSSKAEIQAAIPEKNTALVTYCANLKCPASEKLANHLKSLGYTNVREYPEGIEGWVAAGKAVEDVKK